MSFESGIRLSKVDMPICRIETTCWRVRSASSGISGQMLKVFVLAKIMSFGQAVLLADLNIMNDSWIRQAVVSLGCHHLKLTEA